MKKQLNNHQIRHLKGLAHSKKPSVTVGQNGLKESVIEEIQTTIAHHELIKIKLPAGEKSMRVTLIEDICNRCSSHYVSLIGRTAVIYKPSESNLIQLPK